MKMTVTEAMFKEQFKAYGRGENFSSAGLSALFDYCEDLETDLGEEMELDVIALCCEFTEESFLEIADDCDIDLSEFDELEQFKAVLEYVTNETMVVYANPRTGSILYQNF